MTVLSLFDGISCGQLALQRCGIPVDTYFASEIDENAKVVTQQHFPNTIQLGDVTNIRGADLPTIDLLMGGSPCQGFSFAGKQLNFNDPRSKLFFEFVRILQETTPRWFLLENVKMRRQYRDVITDHLGVHPIEIDSAMFSKQTRKRLYWTNIPIGEITPTSENFDGLLYRLGHGYIPEEIRFFRKYPTLVAQSPGTKYRIVVDADKAQNADKVTLRRDTQVTRVASPEECEEFQTLPIGYTNILPKTQRYKVIGNGWTVNVISHIFKGLLYE